MKRTVEVTIVKRLTVEIMPEMYGSLTPEEYLSEFSKTFFEVSKVEDLIEYAASMFAQHGPGDYEGLGRVAPSGSTYPTPPVVRCDEEWDDIEVDFQETQP